VYQKEVEAEEENEDSDAEDSDEDDDEIYHFFTVFSVSSAPRIS
jgi:hypothetical protein